MDTTQRDKETSINLNLRSMSSEILPIDPDQGAGFFTWLKWPKVRNTMFMLFLHYVVIYMNTDVIYDTNYYFQYLEPPIEPPDVTGLLLELWYSHTAEMIVKDIAIFVVYIVFLIAPEIHHSKLILEWALILQIFILQFMNYSYDYIGYMPQFLCLFLNVVSRTSSRILYIIVIRDWIPDNVKCFMLVLISMAGNVIRTVLLAIETYYDPEFLLYGRYETANLHSIITVLFLILFHILLYDYPANHPTISDRERDYLHSVLGQLKPNRTTQPPPWKRFVKSPSVIALLFASFLYYLFVWGMYVNSTEISYEIFAAVGRYPNSFKFGFNLGYIIVPLIAAFFNDILIHKYNVSTLKLRKMTYLLGTYLVAVFSSLIMYCGKNDFSINTVIALILIGNAFTVVADFVVLVNSLELSSIYTIKIIVLTKIAAELGFKVQEIVFVFYSYYIGNDLSDVDASHTLMLIYIILLLPLLTVFCFAAQVDDQDWRDEYQREPDVYRTTRYI